MQSGPQGSNKGRAIGSTVFFWSGMLIAAEILVSQPPVKGRGAIWQEMARVAVLPGDMVARLLGSRGDGPLTEWTYWLVVFVASFAFWAPVTTYILYRRNWRWGMRQDGSSV